MPDFSPQDYYSRDEVLGILQITAMELGDLITKKVLVGQQIKGKSYFLKAEVETYFDCLENLDYTYEPQSQPYLTLIQRQGVYSSLNTLSLLGINEFDLDFLIRNRILAVFYRGLNWFFPKAQVDEYVAHPETFRRELEAAKRHSSGRMRPVNSFVWTKPQIAPPPVVSATPSKTAVSSKPTDNAKVRSLGDSQAEDPASEAPHEPPANLPYIEQSMEMEDVLELLDIEEYELDLLIAEKLLTPYLKEGALVFSKLKVEHYYEKLKTQNLVCAEENMEELLQVLEDGTYSFRETRARLFLTEFQMEMLERAGALTSFRKGIHRYFNRAKVDELEGDPTAFAQLIASAKRAAGVTKKKKAPKKVFSYTKHYRKRFVPPPVTTEVSRKPVEIEKTPIPSTPPISEKPGVSEKPQELVEARPATPEPQKPSVSDPLSSSSITLVPFEEEILEISPIKEIPTQATVPLEPLTAIPISDSILEPIVDTSALLPPADTSNLLPPEDVETAEINVEEVLRRSTLKTKISPPVAGLVPQTAGETFTYTQTKIVLQMSGKEIQALMNTNKLTQIPQKKSVHFLKEEVLQLRAQMFAVQIEEF